MARFVALLRGVNVGGNKRVPMAEWRDLMAALGYSNVQTLLNSGNAVFESSGRSESAHAKRIQAAIAESMGMETPVIVKSAKEVAAIEAENKLAAIADNPSRLLVAFTSDAATLAGLAALTPLVKAPEQVLVGKHALYLWCPNGSLESKAGEALLGSKIGRAATSRNWATVQKIGELLRAK